MKKVFKGRVEKGKMILADAKGFDLTLWSLNGKEIEVTVGKPVKNRSNPQNRYFHGVILKIISYHTGYSTEEVKEILRAMFLSYDVKIKDEIIKVGRSTASLNTVEFEEFNSKCRQWASEILDVFLPLPNEIDF